MPLLGLVVGLSSRGGEMKNRFYLACARDNVGANMTFHAKDVSVM